jgi:hypothetical protein
VYVMVAAYFLALGGILAIGVRSPHLRWQSAILAIFLLGWAVLILTAQLLSLFSAIGSTIAYIVASLGIAAAISAGLRRIALDRDISVPEWPCPFTPRASFCLGWFLVGTGALVLLGDLVLAYGLLPANPDSIVYRFPRAYWFFGQGSLKHFTNSADPRPMYYPFNAALAYLPLVHFRLGPRSFSILSLLCWLIVVWTTYLFARNLGGSRLVAGATAWLVGLTPNILLQSLSTNDEIIAAAPMLAGLYFVHRWFLRRQFFDAVVGSMGIAISVGTKLHLMFYWPLLLAIALVVALNYRRLLSEAKNWTNVRGASVLVTMTLIFGIFGFSFLAYNYFSAGQLMPWDFAAQVLNKPFNPWVGLQSIVIFCSQIVLTPFADLHFALNSTHRAQHYVAFNQLVAPLFTWVNNGPAYVSAFYRFTGINTPSAVVFNEHTIFIGFSWMAAIIAAALVWRRAPGAPWARFQIMSLPVWFVTYAVGGRYIEGIAVYLGYAVTISGPALVYAFAPIARPSLDRLRWSVLAFVGATHCFFAADILLTSSPRNLIVMAQALWSSSELPLSRGFAIDKSVRDEIDRAQSGVYGRTIGWGQPHWVFMAYHPEIRHLFVSTPKDIPNPNGEADLEGAVSATLRLSRYTLMPPAGDSHLYVYPFPKFPVYGRAAIRVPDLASAGLTWIGDVNFALGPEWVFAAGNGVEQRHQGRDKYIVLTFSEQSNFGHDAKPVLDVAPTLYGLGPTDDLMFRYELKIGGQAVDRTEWNRLPSAQLKTDGLTASNGVLTIFVRNNNAGGTIVSADIGLRSTSATPASAATH